ncbi:MAG: lysylphosphatidylglycerol synthase transmembrane domain-containing protein [Flammeovirgaceae bacterium]
MNKQLMSIFKYLISLSLALGLFWYVYREQDMAALVGKLKEASPFWLLASSVTALFSHWSRGYRWVIALNPLGYQPKKSIAFMGVMVGYFANFFVPRLGEVARCSVLKRTENVPVNVSFGAVVAERAIDFIILLSLTTITFLVEFDKIGNFAMGQFAEKSDEMIGKFTLLAILGAVGLCCLGIIYLMRKRLMKTVLFEKGKAFVIGMKDGLFSIRQLDGKSRWYYALHTLNIWVMYYVMTYVLFFSLEITSNLSMWCALTVLVMGGIGMALPSPGGVGTYHIFVGASLVAYGLTESVGIQFAFLMHGIQTLTVLLVGAICFLIILLIVKKEQQIAEPEETKTLN